MAKHLATALVTEDEILAAAKAFHIGLAGPMPPEKTLSLSGRQALLANAESYLLNSRRPALVHNGAAAHRAEAPRSTSGQYAVGCSAPQTPLHPGPLARLQRVLDGSTRANR